MNWIIQCYVLLLLLCQKHLWLKEGEHQLKSNVVYQHWWTWEAKITYKGYRFLKKYRGLPCKCHGIFINNHFKYHGFMFFGGGIVNMLLLIPIKNSIHFAIYRIIGIKMFTDQLFWCIPIYFLLSNRVEWWTLQNWKKYLSRPFAFTCTYMYFFTDTFIPTTISNKITFCRKALDNVHLIVLFCWQNIISLKYKTQLNIMFLVPKWSNNLI